MTGEAQEEQCSYHDGDRRCVRPAGHRWAHMGAEPAADIGAYAVPDAVEFARDALPPRWEELTDVTGGFGLLRNLWAVTGAGPDGDIQSLLDSAVPSLRRVKWHAESFFEDVNGEKRWRKVDATTWVYEVRRG